MDDDKGPADFAVHDLSPRTRSGSTSSGHKRIVSGSLFSRLSFLRMSQGVHTSPARHNLEMEHDDTREDFRSRMPQGTGKGGTTSSRAMSAALAQHRTRRRRGSLRKTALLGTRLESRDKRAAAKAAEALEALRAEPSRLPAVDPQESVKLKDQTSPDNEFTSRSPRENEVFDDDDHVAQQPTWFGATTIQKPMRPSITRRRQGLVSHNHRGQEPATDDEDLVPFTHLHTSPHPTTASPKTGAATGLHISPPSSSSGSFYSLQAQPEPTYMPVHRHKSSPLVTHPVEMKSSPEVDVDYSETEWWGWIILMVTWLVFVVGIGSCFEVWSWAWDVGETPYAPPELEDDPTLPIVGYYPALIILTAVMSWVWVVVAWIGMKYFKHANISGEDI